MILIEVMGSFVAALVLTIILTPFINRLAFKTGIVRKPGGRHGHNKPTPLLGGAVVISATIVVVALYPTLVVTPATLMLMFGLLLVGGMGIFDDISERSWRVLLLGQVLAAAFLLFGGVALEYINSPFGGAIRLDGIGTFQIPQVLCAAGECTLPILGSALLVVWIVVIMNAINWLDGSDGIAPAVSAIALFAIAALALTPNVLQPPLAIIALAGAGAAVGFFFFNRPPARLFLGSAGSFGLGYLISGLAVLAGAKLATVSLVLLVPLADAVAVLIKRQRRGVALTGGDMTHLHHTLKRRGASSNRVLIIHAVSAFVFAVAAVFLPHPIKSIVLVGAFVILVWILAKEEAGHLDVGLSEA